MAQKLVAPVTIVDSQGKHLATLDGDSTGLRLLHATALRLVDSHNVTRISLEHGDAGTHDSTVLVNDDTGWPCHQISAERAVPVLACKTRPDAGNERAELFRAVLDLQKQVKQLQDQVTVILAAHPGP